MNPPREPWLAVTWAAIFPGLGQAYAGDVRAAWGVGIGVIVLIAAAAAFLFLPGGSVLAGYALLAVALALVIGSLFHAHALARRTLTPEADAERRSQRDAWKAVCLSLLIPGLGQLYDRRGLSGAFFLALFFLASNVPEPFARFSGEILATIAMFEAWRGATGRRGADGPELRRAIVVRVAVVALALVVTVGVRATLVRAARVPSMSMEPTLKRGDYFLIDVTRHGRADRDDIVVHTRPGSTAHEYAKRVLGIGGDEVEIRPDGAWRNGEKVLEGPGFAGAPPGGLIGASGSPFRVPSATAYVVGDWLANSEDSRYFGPLPLSAIRGRAYKIYWPLSRARTLTPAPGREGTPARTTDHP